MAKVKDYYLILGVDEDAAADEIKKAFIGKADTIEKSGDSTAMDDLQEAFKVLSNAKRRRLYDQYRQGDANTTQLNTLTQGSTGELPNGSNGHVAAKAPMWSYLTLKSSSNYGTTKYFINDDLQPDLKNGDFTEIINILGSEGWEMIGISTVASEQTFIFKKPTNEKFVPDKKGPAA